MKSTSVLDKLGIGVGYRTTHEKTITEAEINLFSTLSGDYNPVHLDDQFAGKTIFGGRIAHGAFSVSLLSAAMSKIPGVVIFVSLAVKYLGPVRIGDTITAVAQVTGLRKEKSILLLKNECVNQRGEVVVTGEAAVRIYESPP